ncbi:MAG: hypothetical protein IH934_08000 [Nanoarchaeota archaeon]|nr:hypothetical protein [Nanoarchaeota archaeon]
MAQGKKRRSSTKGLRLKQKDGSVINLPLNLVKNILSKAGYVGKHLALTTTGIINEAGKLATNGVVTTTQLEKAIVRAVYNANNILMDNTVKITKKVLKK